MATKEGASNVVPFFITIDGPIRSPRVPNPAAAPPGGVNLYTITGRVDAPGCFIAQPDFRALAAAGNLSFHVPPRLFGKGLVEAIDDGDRLARGRRHRNIIRQTQTLAAQEPMPQHVLPRHAVGHVDGVEDVRDEQLAEGCARRLRDDLGEE